MLPQLHCGRGQLACFVASLSDPVFSHSSFSVCTLIHE